MKNNKQKRKKKFKINSNQIIAIILLIATIGMFMSSIIFYI